MIRFGYVFATALFLAAPLTAEAQGLVGGAERGAAAGDRALGPIGGLVGGAVGAGVGTVNGALGINPHYRRSYYRRCIRRNRHLYCR